jgi:molybdopterin molybdotransferase
VRPGEAMRIFTGAPVPEGADAIVMVERTERLDGGAAVAISVPATPATTCAPPATTWPPATWSSRPARS